MGNSLGRWYKSMVLQFLNEYLILVKGILNNLNRVGLMYLQLLCFSFFLFDLKILNQPSIIEASGCINKFFIKTLALNDLVGILYKWIDNQLSICLILDIQKG
jgi:hypothetical protein